METKSLLYGLIGFFIGGFIVAVAATTINKPETKETTNTNSTMSSMSMDDMSTDLRNKTGDEYDEAFITSMIAHHESAVDMAGLSAKNAKHDEIKQLSLAIIAAQAKEISEMKQWQKDWNYSTTMNMDHDMMGQ